MKNTRCTQTSYHLDAAADALKVAYWTDNPYHVANAREALTKALCGDYEEQVLIDVIEEAIDDVHDFGVTSRDYAKSVVKALLDYAAPVPATPEGGK